MEDRGQPKTIYRPSSAVRPPISPGGSLQAINAIPSWGREASTFIYHQGPFCGILGIPAFRDVYGTWVGQQMSEPQMNHGKSDTSPEARRVLYDLYRRMPLGRRLELVFDMCDTGRALAIAGLRMRHPDATEEGLQKLWARQHLGQKLFEQVYGGEKRG